MTEPGQRIYHLALRDMHLAMGASFAVASGWSLPLHYGDPALEHAALRQRAVVFDRSQRSRILVTGTDAHVVLGAVFAGYIDEIEEGRARRTVALDRDGRIRDVALVARTGGIAYLVSGEPGQRFETIERLNASVGENFDVRIEDRTETTCMIGLAGPNATNVAREHFADGLPPSIETLHAVTFLFHGFRGMAIRTSDTGEDGYELMLAPAVAQHLIETLRGAGVPMAGAIALESARVEACIPAFAPDLETGLTPAEADLDVLLSIEGGAHARILAGLLFDGEPMPPGVPILVDGREVGEVRSCLRSLGLNATIGLGIIDAHDALPGREFLAGGPRAVVVAKPFYRRRRQG